MKAAQFDCGDFYPIETLLHARYRRKWYGGYEKIMQVTWSSECVIDGEVEHKSQLITSVIDCTDFDLVKLCLSFVFWTREGGIPANVLSWLRRNVFCDLIYESCNDGSKGILGRITDDVIGWNYWTLTAAVMYLIKYTSRASDWHHAVVRELLVKFLGADGYGNRDFVFGRYVHSRFTVPYMDALSVHGCGNSLHPDNVVSQLVAEYNRAMSKCPQVTLIVDRLNLEVANCRAVKKARDDLVLFLTKKLGAPNNAVTGVIDNAKINKIPASINNLLLHTDKLITLYERQTSEDSRKIYSTVCAMKGSKKWTQESCPYCWMVSNGMDKSCKQHLPTVGSALTAQSQIEFLKHMRALTSTPAVPETTQSQIEAPKLLHTFASDAAPAPSAPPAEDMPLDCAVCFVARINTRIAPCGHTCCKGCADRLTLCPQCRGEIKSRDVIYI
jgi:Zinc finger, C3HC4 type (RING finger)